MTTTQQQDMTLADLRAAADAYDGDEYDDRPGEDDPEAWRDAWGGCDHANVVQVSEHDVQCLTCGIVSA